MKILENCVSLLNKIPLTMWLVWQKFIFSPFWSLEDSDQGASMVQVWCFLLCHHKAFSWGSGRKEEKEFWHLFLQEETVKDFIFLGSKITVDGDSSHDIKRGLFLGRKAMTNLNNVLNSKYITLLSKVHIVKALVFPVVMYGCESWTITEAECWRIDAFKLWCWRRLLRVR